MLPHSASQLVLYRALHLCDDIITADDLVGGHLGYGLVRALERRRLRAQLAVTQRERLLADAKLMLLLLSGTSPIVVLDEGEKVIFVNRPAEHLLGQPARELYGWAAPREFAGEPGLISRVDGVECERQRTSIRWGCNPATLIVLAAQGPADERWRDAHDGRAVAQARLGNAHHELGQLRRLVDMAAPVASRAAMAEVMANLARDLTGARGMLAHVGRELGTPPRGGASD